MLMFFIMSYHRICTLDNKCLLSFLFFFLASFGRVIYVDNGHDNGFLFFFCGLYKQSYLKKTNDDVITLEFAKYPFKHHRQRKGTLEDNN